MANGMNFAELLKEVCDELIAQGEDISKYGNVVIDSMDSLADKGYELELTQQSCDVQQVKLVEPKSYYTTYYGQDVATVGTARGYASAYGTASATKVADYRYIKPINPFEVDLV